MQTLINIAFGAMVAGASLGPAVWSDISHIDASLSEAASLLMGVEEHGAPLAHALANARAVLPNGRH